MNDPVGSYKMSSPNSTVTIPTDVVLGDYTMYHNSSHERGFVHSAGFGIFIIVWNFLVNSLLILVLLCRRHTRSQYIYSQVVNLAITDLLYSVLVDTLTVYYELERWGLGQHVCKAWMVLDVIIPFVSFLIIILLNIDRLIFAFKPSLYYTLFRRGLSRAVVIVLPWIVSSVVLSPLWLLSSVVEPYPEFCIYGITSAAIITSSLLSLFFPAIAITVLTVMVLVTMIGGLPDELGQFISLGASGQRLDKKIIKRRHRSIVTAMCLVNFCTLAMQLPFGAISLLQPQCTDEGCTDIVKLLQALSWLRSACPGVRPLCWLVIAEFRQSCCCCCCCCPDGSFSTKGQTDQLELASASALTANEHLTCMNSSHYRNENSVHEKG